MGRRPKPLAAQLVSKTVKEFWRRTLCTNAIPPSLPTLMLVDVQNPVVLSADPQCHGALDIHTQKKCFYCHTLEPASSLIVPRLYPHFIVAVCAHC